jgi:hypothetical protein
MNALGLSVQVLKHAKKTLKHFTKDHGQLIVQVHLRHSPTCQFQDGLDEELNT